MTAWLPKAPEALNSSEWPDADWLCLDGCQTGHHDGWKDTDIKAPEEGASKAQSGAAPMPMWFARSSYIPIRKMYSARTKHGKPRPWMDLEPHYEMIHPGFDVSGLRWSTWSNMGSGKSPTGMGMMYETALGKGSLQGEYSSVLEYLELSLTARQATYTGAAL